MRQASLVHRSHGSSVKNENEKKSDNGSKKIHNGSCKGWRQNARLHNYKTLVLVVALVVILYIIMKSTSSWNNGSSFSTRKRDTRHYPLVIQIVPRDNDDKHHDDVIRLAQEEHPQHLVSNRRNRYWVNHLEEEDSDASYANERKEWPKGDCEALGDWQTGDACNCNSFHETSMTDFYDVKTDYQYFQYIKDGGFRIAWMIREYNGTERVLKTLRFIDKRHFDIDNLERHRRDAIAAEQLTFSPYIADMYGHCAQSSLVDYSPHVSLYHIFKDNNPTFDELFQIAYDAVAAVADTHHFNKDGRATIAHMDIKPNQWIFLDGRYKLNDYNICKFLSWDPARNQHCGRTSGYSEGRWQAPEQYKRKAPLTEKVDVYSLGNVLYFLLTNGTKPFHDMDAGDAFRYLGKKRGKLKIEDPAILNSTHPFHVNVIHAMEMCHEHDPAKRVDARQVRDFLGPKLDEYLKKQAQGRSA